MFHLKGQCHRDVKGLFFGKICATIHLDLLISKLLLARFLYKVGQNKRRGAAYIREVGGRTLAHTVQLETVDDFSSQALR